MPPPNTFSELGTSSRERDAFRQERLQQHGRGSEVTPITGRLHSLRMCRLAMACHGLLSLKLSVDRGPHSTSTPGIQPWGPNNLQCLRAMGRAQNRSDMINKRTPSQASPQCSRLVFDAFWIFLVSFEPVSGFLLGWFGTVLEVSK